MFKLSQHNTPPLSGPEVDRLISVVHEMFRRGAPDEFDDLGFNKSDWDCQTMQHIKGINAGSAVSLQIIVDAMNRLKKYKNTQLQSFTDFDSLRNDMFNVIQRSTPTTTDDALDCTVKKVQYVRPGKFDKHVFFIPGFSKGERVLKRRIIQKIQELHESGNEKYRQREDRYSGELKWPHYMVFEREKEGMDLYQIHPDVMHVVADLLEEKKYGEYDVSSLRNFSAQPQKAKKVKSLSFNDGMLIINLGDYVEPAINLIRMQPDRKPAKEDNGDWIWKIPNPSVAFLEELSSILQDKSYDTTEIKGIIESLESDDSEVQQVQDTDENQGPLIEAYDVSEKTGGKWLMHIPYPGVRKLGETLNEHFKDVLKYNFVGFTKDINEDNQNIMRLGVDYGVYLRGVQNDFYDFGKILKARGFNVSGIKVVVSQLISKGLLQTGRQKGELDGYESGDDFVSTARSYQDAFQNEFYPEQVDGISFLYGNQSALLGDDVGVGKCLIDANIQTSYGDMLIQDLWDKHASRIVSYQENEEWGDVPDDMFVHSVDDYGKIVKGRVVNLFRQKYKGKMIKYKTSNGKTIKSTPAHRFLTPFGWKSDLNTGDRICSSSNQFDLYENNRSSIESDLAFFIAWQISEGHESKTRATLNIYQKDRSILEELKSIYDKWGFGKSYIRLTKKGMYKLEISSKLYKEFLEDMGYEWGFVSKEKIIPDFIMRSTDDQVKIFLRSFFDAEGSVRKNARGIELSSASSKLIYQLSLLLQRFNIFVTFAKKYKCATNGSKIKRPYYEIRPSGTGIDIFIREIGFGCNKKQKKLLTHGLRCINPNKEGKPAFVALKPFFNKHNIPTRLLNITNQRYVSGDTWMGHEAIDDTVSGMNNLKTGEALSQYQKLGRSKWTDSTICALKNVDDHDIDKCVHKLKELRNNDLQYEEIVDIEEVGYDGYIYDLSVEGHQNYIAENLICHNTPQCIVAADIRLKQSGGKCVVVTVNSVVSQYMEQIIKIAQIDPKDVSDDPFSDAQYRVLKYTLFSSQGSREDVTKHLVEEAMSGDITVLILDEIHNVKNGDPRKRNKNGYLKHTSNHTTFNIQEVSQHIPFVWGASATIVANKPVDLYNQLVAINHKMGKLPYGGFKYVFDPDDKKQKLVAADKIKEILLDQRIYVQRTKQAIRGDMPEQFVSASHADVNISGLNNQVKERLFSSKNPDHPLAGMTAFRTSIAEFKVPKSLSLAEDIIRQGKKVAIFTNFNPSADMLVLGLNNIFETHEIDGSVAQIRGGQRNRQQVIEDFTNPGSNSKAIVINIRAGGTGLDFPNILTDIIVNDFDWSVAQDKQSLGRFYRINSEQDINVTYVIANNTADLVMYQKLEGKREIADRITSLSEEEMQILNDGIRGNNERLREIREARHRAIMEQDQMQSDNDIIQNIGSQIIRDANEDILASSYFAPRRSWYGILKTQYNY